jgi:hypothetical protein
MEEFRELRGGKKSGKHPMSYRSLTVGTGKSLAEKGASISLACPG